MKILILSPHPDDAELCMGGSIYQMTQAGHDVKMIYYSPCDIENVFHEVSGSMQVLGVKDWNMKNYPRRIISRYSDEIRDELYGLRPDRVYCPHPQDVHQDHEAISREAVRAFNNRAEIYYYIWPKNVDKAKCTVYQPLTGDDVKVKIRALQSYQSQVELRSGYFNPATVIAMAKYYGLRFGYDFAEAFEPYKIKQWI